MMSEKELSQFLTVREVAHLVRCSPRTVLRWIDAGQLAAARLPGGEFRIRCADVEALLLPVQFA